MTTSEAERVEIAIARISEGAGETWLDSASKFFLDYTTARGEAVLTEDVKDAWTRAGGPAPHDPRAWGAVVRRLQRAGDIIYMGKRRAASSHNSLRPTWFVL